LWRKFRFFSNVSVLLINEKYVPSELGKKLILIDTPGLDQTWKHPVENRKLEALTFFFELSDMALFLVSPNEISSIEKQIRAFETAAIGSLLHRNTRALLFDTVTKNDMVGIPPEMASNLPIPNLDKVRFVITKIDNELRNSNYSESERSLRLRALTFDLGLKLGSELKLVDHPRYGKHVMLIGVPEPQPKHQVFTQDLELLKGEIQSIINFSSYQQRVNSIIIDMNRQMQMKHYWIHQAWHPDIRGRISERIERASRRIKARVELNESAV
jgi:hypothetical protein